MKSVAIFFTLVFLTGFQAAVLSEKPPPSVSEPNQSVLEQLQEQFGKASAQVTDSINGGVNAIKERTSDFMTYTLDLGKKVAFQKVINRKFASHLRDLQTHVQTFFNQSKEMIKKHYIQAVEMVEEMKKHPATVALHGEVVEPFLKKGYTAASWIADQSIASMTNMVQKKLTY